ncbi:hypothetical protein [Persephonella sp.]
MLLIKQCLNCCKITEFGKCEGGYELRWRLENAFEKLICENFTKFEKEVEVKKQEEIAKAS